MTIPTISTLPTAPARTDAPATFISRADAFLAALVTMQGELNTSIGAMNADFITIGDNVTAAQAAQTAAEAAQSAAETAETNAETAETNAETAQTAAEAAQAAAESAQSSTEAVYDAFDDRYLGAKASDPTLDNDGNALQTGAQYFNTTNDVTRVYNGSGWQDSAAIATSIIVSQISDYTGTATELNYTDGVTSNIQTQLDAKGVGSVTSVGGTGSVQGLTLSGSVTSSGNLTLGGSLSGINISTQTTGTLPVNRGGTGATSLTANNVLLGNGTSAPQAVAPSTAGNILTSNGTTWESVAPAGGAAGWTLLGSASGTNVTYISLPSVFSSTYDEYAIIFAGETFGNGRLDAQFYKSGSYVTASVYDLKTLYMANTSPSFLSASSQVALNLVYGPNQQNSTYTGTIVHVNSTDDIQVPTIYGVGTARNYLSQNTTKMDNASYRGPVNGIRVLSDRGYGTLSGTLRIYGIDKG